MRGRTSLGLVPLLVSLFAAGCGDGSTGPAEPRPVIDDTPLNGSGPTVRVQFESYCSTNVEVYATNASGSSCTRVSSPVTPGVAAPNAYSASTSGTPNCAAGTRVEITPGSDGDVMFDISTNGSYAPQPVPYFDVPVQFLALQRTAKTRCSLAPWDGQTGAENLRGVSTQVCADATCPTAYQKPESGPQFVVRDTAASTFLVEWCPTKNPAPLPTCVEPPFSSAAPCPNLCWTNAVESAAPCADFSGHVMCNIAPFGGNPPGSYCLESGDCTRYGKPCGCCTSDADCSGGEACVDFLCQ